MTLIRVLRFPALVDFEAEDRRLVLDLGAGAHGAWAGGQRDEQRRACTVLRCAAKQPATVRHFRWGRHADHATRRGQWSECRDVLGEEDGWSGGGG